MQNELLRGVSYRKDAGRKMDRRPQAVVIFAAVPS